jgi:hypothetical protein
MFKRFFHPFPYQQCHIAGTGNDSGPGTVDSDYHPDYSAGFRTYLNRGLIDLDKETKSI